MRIIRWLIVSLLVAVLLLAIWLRQDEPLSSVSQELLALQPDYQPHLREHPYFLALGFDAKENIDPMILGRLRYHQDWAYYFHHPVAVDGAYSAKLAITENLKGCGLNDEIKNILSSP